ncbi:MAG: hypothetical protein BWY73_00765 [candidate division TA06 bacterium ADurb.Bin417]|uniref:Uncharacterized protein n=1 Tax=candidate division TA06 bacterium ADurb.Bin417 TaxID=1852828 RepID=A0A1V5MHA1_UNCT6|nr:MAG: hypothetical protein BWY73_00765 [candidate division TA06 bacterium ADurb.Bin417]
MAGRRNRPALNQATLALPGRGLDDGAQDGRFAGTAPALVSLAELPAVAAAGKVPETAAVVIDQVDVGAGAAGQLQEAAGRIMNIAVVLLDQHRPGPLRLTGTAVLRMEVAPGRPLQDQPVAAVLQVKDQQAPAPGRLLRVPERQRRRQPPAVGTDGGKRVDPARKVPGAGDRGIDDGQGPAIAAGQFDPLENQAGLIRLAAVHQVIDQASVRAHRGSDCVRLGDQGRPGASRFQVAEQVLVLRVVR